MSESKFFKKLTKIVVYGVAIYLVIQVIVVIAAIVSYFTYSP